MTSIQKRTTAALSVMLVAFSLLFFKNEMLVPIRAIFDSGLLPYALWAYVITSVVMHKWIVSETVAPHGNFFYQQFGKYAESVFAIGTYGVGGSTSLALLRGLYTQYFFDGEFFKGFSAYDLISMMVLSSFLLVYSVLNSTRLLKDALYFTSTSSVKPSAQNPNSQ